MADESSPLYETVRSAENSWFPVFVGLLMAGCEDVTIHNTRLILQTVYRSGGIKAMAKTVKSWNNAVRAILEDNPETRDGSQLITPAFCRTAESLIFEFRKSTTCMSTVRMDGIIATQGRRPIPPFCSDVNLIDALGPYPTFDLKERLVHLSNMSRTQAVPGSEEIEEALGTFKSNVEAIELNRFYLRGLARKFGTQLKPSFHVNSSHWSLSVNSSLEFTHGMDGKAGEVRERILNEFCVMPTSYLFPERPVSNLFDITGSVVMRPDDWSPDKPIWETVYLSHFLALGPADERLGHIGLLWALWTIRFKENGFVNVPNEFFQSCTTYGATKCELSSTSSFRARISPQPEEGWKVRVITITSLAVSIIGGIARHLLDPYLWSAKSIKVGLLGGKKLYEVLEMIGGYGTAYHGSKKKGRVPDWCVSVDLSTATDTPSRRVVYETLHGLLDGISHPQDSFLRFAVDVTCSERVFFLSKEVKSTTCPTVHNSGVMMGEGLSGIFLNTMSGIVRSVISQARVNHPGLLYLLGGTNSEIDQNLSKMFPHVQRMIDNLDFAIHPLSSQSGDDGVFFCDSKGAAEVFRIFFRIFGMIPSPRTFYESNSYATFTEEAAIRTWDSNGWKFVDTVKLRVFQTSDLGVTGSALVSRIGLLRGYLSYITNPLDRRRVVGEKYAYKMLQRVQSWKHYIERYNPPLGFPLFLGGIEHPCGIDPRYIETVSEDDKAIVKYILDLPPMEALAQIYLPHVTEEVPDVDVEDKIREFIIHFNNHLSDMPEGFVIDLDKTHPFIRGQKTLDIRDSFKKENNLVSLLDMVNETVSKISFQTMLSSSARPTVVKYPQASRNRLTKLRTLSATVDRGSIDTADLSLWKIKDTVFNRAKALVVNKESISGFLMGQGYPSLNLKFR